MHCYWSDKHLCNKPKKKQQKPQTIKINLRSIPIESRKESWQWIKQNFPDLAELMQTDFWEKERKEGGFIYVEIEKENLPKWADYLIKN